MQIALYDISHDRMLRLLIINLQKTLFIRFVIFCVLSQLAYGTKKIME